MSFYQFMENTLFQVTVRARVRKVRVWVRVRVRVRIRKVRKIRI